ncbi:retroviral-like aspartic protease family protein [Gluconobacter albidus]|uniref:retroviral-like aspartic protease family protein n=1 Tax=Gluconobacter albidus TaxID=318683 RepID=UPI00209C8D9F|nr:retroviral-like aspartic protease family protein [Gluconobacter albidus]MCP1273096.1 retroviral-like aspartic protease family protein [Gluconobacter albidus]
MKRLLSAILILGLCTASSPAAPVCEMSRAVVLPLRDDGGYLSVPVTVNGHNASMIVDTGSEGSLMTPGGGAAFHLPPDPEHRTMMQGPNGAPRVVPNIRIQDLRLGTPHSGELALGAGTMAVGILPGSPMITPPVFGLLGADVLADYDLEFDVPHQRLTLWRVRLGSHACQPPPAWTGHWTTMPMHRISGRLTVPFTLDGLSGTALLDSGARSHIVSTDFAHRLGLTDDQLALDPGGMTSGVDLRERPYHWHHFKRFELGNTFWNHPVLTVAPVHDQADMLLGSDWFAHHEIWLSYASGQLFFR